MEEFKEGLQLEDIRSERDLISLGFQKSNSLFGECEVWKDKNNLLLYNQFNGKVIVSLDTGKKIESLTNFIY
jgi:hypothetical protein